MRKIKKKKNLEEANYCAIVDVVARFVQCTAVHIHSKYRIAHMPIPISSIKRVLHYFRVNDDCDFPSFLSRPACTTNKLCGNVINGEA